MRNVYLFYFFFFSLIIYFPTGAQGENPFVSEEQAKKLLQDIPVQFIENKGQMTDIAGKPIPFVLFKAESPGLHVYITEKGLSYIFYKYEEESNEEEREREEKSKKNSVNIKPPSEDKEDVAIKWERIDMELKGASILKANVFKEEASRSFSQYFLAHCPEGITDVHSFKKIIIKNIYPNIDWLIYNAEGKGFKYDFIVHPGADPQQIKLVYSALNPLNKNKNGELKITTKIGELNEFAPYCYTKEKNQKIESEFQIISQEKINKYYQTVVGFKLIDFTASNSQTLVIDPQLTWATFFSGVDMKTPNSIACDSAGNVFITVASDQINLPSTNPGSGAYFQGTLSGAGTMDIIISKFSNSGVLIWATYYGGTGNDSGFSINIEKNGNVYVVGYTTSTDFPTQNPGGSSYFQIANAGSYDVCILKFNNAGVRLWATYFGGNAFEFCKASTLDGSGNFYLVTYGSDGFPTQNLAGAYNLLTAPGTSGNIIISKFNNLGTLVWSTYYGGIGEDQPGSINADAMGNIVITGTTQGTDFPLQNVSGAYNQVANAGKWDAFVVKFSSSCALLWSTYFGGPGRDVGSSIDFDSNGNIFLAGSTDTTNFPTLNPGGGAYFQGTYAGTYWTGFSQGTTNLFISKFNNIGALVWSTYLGGDGNSFPGDDISTDNDALVIDNCGNIYLTFFTGSTNIATLDAGNGSYFQGTAYPIGATGWDGVVASFTNSGSLTWATYFGGGGADDVQAIALDANNNLFMTGEWAAYDNGSNPVQPPLTDPGGGAYYNSTPALGSAGFIAKFNKMPLTVTTSSSTTNCGCTGSASVTNSTGGIAPYTYNWSNGQTTQTVTGLCAGTITVTVNDSLCSSQTQVLTISATGIFSIDTLVTAATCSNSSNGSATVTPSGGTAPYIYAWSPSGGTDATASGLSAGTYTVSITDSTGCTQSKTVTITSTSSAITISTSATPNSSCNANGTVTAAAAGGSGAFTYLWSNSQTTSTATGLAGGTYTVTVTDGNGCFQTQTVIITDSVPTISLTINTTENTSCNANGTATATPTGGTSPYSYLWANGQTTQTAIGLANGIDSVTVTDANGCIQTQTAIITGFAPTISVAMLATNAGCTGTSGTGTATPSGGTVPYTYLWNNGQTSQTAVNLAPGSYSVTVTDSMGCIQNQSIVITGLTIPAPTATAQPTLIIGQGTSQLTATGGVTYSWLPATGLSCDTCPSPVATPLQTTTYCVLVTGANSCSDSACVTIQVEIPCESFIVPTAFSPNDDGNSDVFIIPGLDNCVETYSFAIYDRWGEKVFETQNAATPWDGSYKGKPLDSAVFAYTMSLTLTGGKKVTKKGNISLIR